MPEHETAEVVEKITALVINFRTLDHTRTCLDTLRAAYPTLPVLVVDNGSADSSTDFLRERAEADPGLRVIFNESNVFHGPALHQGMLALQTDYVFLLDSDVVVQRSGFLEVMLEAFRADPLLYAVGKRGWTNRYGYAPVDAGQAHTAYVHPFAGLFDRRKYLTLPPFQHHGAPLYRNMWGARRAGYHLEHMPVEDWLVHIGKVTASVHGYGYDRRLRAQARAHRAEHLVRRVLARLRSRQLRPPALPPAQTTS
jgi:glycosyltransferase involved in cell wall biosynthesis